MTTGGLGARGWIFLCSVICALCSVYQRACRVIRARSVRHPCVIRARFVDLCAFARRIRARSVCHPCVIRARSVRDTRASHARSPDFLPPREPVARQRVGPRRLSGKHRAHLVRRPSPPDGEGRQRREPVRRARHKRRGLLPAEVKRDKVHGPRLREVPGSDAPPRTGRSEKPGCSITCARNGARRASHRCPRMGWPPQPARRRRVSATVGARVTRTRRVSHGPRSASSR